MNNTRTSRDRFRWLLMTACVMCTTFIAPGLTGGAETKAGRQPHAKAERQKQAGPAGRAQSQVRTTKKPLPAAAPITGQTQAAALRRLAAGTKSPAPPQQSQMRQLAALLKLRALQQMARANPSLLPRGGRPQVLDGWQVRLIDGDTFAYGSERIRIRGIDTPEKSESGGFEATQRLDLLLREGQIMVVPEAVDKYGRIVADVYVNGRNLAEVLRSEGYMKPEKH